MPLRCLSCRVHFSLSKSAPTYSFRAFYHASTSSTRPPSIPEPAPDIKHIRNNPGLYEINCAQRNYLAEKDNGWKILELRKQLNESRISDQKLFKQQKEFNKRIGELSRRGDEAEKVKMLSDPEIRQLTVDVDQSKQCRQSIENTIHELALQLPNLSAQHVPEGPDPEVISRHNSSPGFASPIHTESHIDIATSLGIIDTSIAARISGTGFYYFLGQGALLEQALIQHALRKCLRAGFILVSPPTLVHKFVGSMAGYAPRDTNGETQIFEIVHEQGESQRVLTGTSEIALAGMFTGQALNADELPKKYVGISRCYRAEAGGRGKDTKGIYRVHEFTKVELFAWTLPNQSGDEEQKFKIAEEESANQMFREIHELQKDILEPLGLPMRVLNMPPADLGVSAAMKYDIEAFFPSREHAHWGELASLSLCTDYQSRRMSTTIKCQGQSESSKYPYTLNGTALAVPRVWAALIENGWDPVSKRVKIPECLHEYMGCSEIG